MQLSPAMRYNFNIAGDRFFTICIMQRLMRIALMLQQGIYLPIRGFIYQSLI